MGSEALTTWQSTRRVRLDRLVDAHRRVGGGAPGRPRAFATDELNQAIFLRLAAEFQGFCRDLHTECVQAVVDGIVPGTPTVERIVLAHFTSNRQLDRGNAHPGAIGSDFARFGMTLWEDVHAQYYHATTWHERLELLNTTRNGIAHDDLSKLREVRAAGWTLSLRAVQRWRGSLDGLARAMDTVCQVHLTTLFGRAPW